MVNVKPVSFKNEYETVFILNPDLPGDEQRKAVDVYIQMIKDEGGAIHNIERWGMRRLAYPIEKKTNGVYTYVEFTSSPDFIAKLDQAYRYDDNVLRFLTVKLDKHALAYNVKRREQGFGLRKDAKTS